MRRRPGARSSSASPSRRCAVYTRVSTDHGLEQDFNSLEGVPGRRRITDLLAEGDGDAS